jgi:hypothetical protein
MLNAPVRQTAMIWNLFFRIRMSELYCSRVKGQDRICSCSQKAERLRDIGDSVRYHSLLKLASRKSIGVTCQK